MAKDGGGAWGSVASALVGGAANILGSSGIGVKRQYKYSKRLANYQNELNRANAEWVYQKDAEALAKQLEYDSPAQQMARFKAAGLNPNLIYGSGTPGNMGSPLEFPTMPGVQMMPVNAQAGLQSIGSDLQQGYLTAAQTNLTQARTGQTEQATNVAKAQEAVLRANPNLQPGYLDALVSQLEATAAIKQQEATFKTGKQVQVHPDGSTTEGQARGVIIMQEQMDQLMQKYHLNQKDLKIKAQIIQSKEFRNELDKIQVEWLKNGEITPQHIYMGIMMLLQKMM